MMEGTGRRAFLLILFCLAGGAIAMAGQGSQMQQNARVTRETLSPHAAEQRQQQAAARPSSLSTSHTPSSQQPRSASNSASQPHAPAVHTGRTPYTGGRQDQGGRDLRFANLNRYQTQMPGTGRGSMLAPAALAAGRQGLANHSQVGPRNARQVSSSEASDRQSAADQAARERSAPASVRGGSSTRSQGRPDSGSRPNPRQR